MACLCLIIFAMAVVRRNSHNISLVSVQNIRMTRLSGPFRPSATGQGLWWPIHPSTGLLIMWIVWSCGLLLLHMLPGCTITCQTSTLVECLLWKPSPRLRVIIVVCWGQESGVTLHLFSSRSYRMARRFQNSKKETNGTDLGFQQPAQRSCGYGPEFDNQLC